MNFAFGEVEEKGRGAQSTPTAAGPLKGEGHGWRAGLPSWPSIILLKGKYAVSKKKKKKIKTSQLIIIPMALPGFRTSQVREDKLNPLSPELLSSGELMASALCFHVSRANFLSFLFSLFFFLWGILSVKNMACLYGAPARMKL